MHNACIHPLKIKHLIMFIQVHVYNYGAGSAASTPRVTKRELQRVPEAA